MLKHDWNPASDQLIRPGAVQLQSELHQRMYTAQFQNAQAARNWLARGRTAWRRKVLEKSSLIMGEPIHGQVLEIGAGTGWASALMSQMPAVQHVDVLEYDPYCVDTLIPQVFKVLNGDVSKAARVYGSFHRIQPTEHYNVIVSIGALHHAEDLEQVLLQCFKALKPGGWLIATEPCEDNDRTHRQIVAKGEKEDPNALRKYGRRTKHKDNSDHYVKLYEWEAAAFWAGFDVWAFTFDTLGDPAGDGALKNRVTYHGLRKVVMQPYFAKDGEFDRLLLACQRPA